MAKRDGPAVSRALQRREDLCGYAFLLPSLIFFAAFVLLPMVLCIGMSFTDANMQDETIFSNHFVGLYHYRALWRDETFREALGNTVVIVLVSVPAVCGFSLWAASVINRLGRFSRTFCRVAFYLPLITGSVAVTAVWKWIYDGYTGLLNAVLTGAGLIEQNINWLGDRRFALGCIILILFTTSVGQPIVLYTAALGSVDRTLLEAAGLDGASRRQVFWRITWPQIMPVTLYILIITTINSFQCFALIQLLTSGSAGTNTVMYYIYFTAFKLTEQLGHFGYANAMGVVLAVLIGILSAIQFRLAKER